MALDDSNPFIREYTENELNAMTKAQLLDLCKELGMEGVCSSNLKAEIVTAILSR